MKHSRAGRGTSGVNGMAGNGAGIARARPLDFERRVSEADAYLQIMIDQVNVGIFTKHNIIGVF